MNQSIRGTDLSRPIVLKRDFIVLDLRRHFNNDGISYDDWKNDGDFDGKGSTFPAEELPPSNSLIFVDSVPFYFPSKERGFLNNMALTGQSIAFDPVLLEKVHILGAVEGQNGEVYEEEVTVSAQDGTYHPVFVGLSNWLLPAQYNERIAFQCSHLHFPDPGQETVMSAESQDIEEYTQPAEPHYFSQPSSESRDKENGAKGIWCPRIWRQEKRISLSQPTVGLTFMDNLNFHVFAMTLERKASR
jgi:hypothetical protein